MIETIVDAIADDINTDAAAADGDWTASIAVQAAENPPPVIDDEDEAA